MFGVNGVKEHLSLIFPAPTTTRLGSGDQMPQHHHRLDKRMILRATSLALK